MKELYVRIVLLVASLVIWYGILCPFLISQPSDILTLLGFAALFAYPILVWNPVKSLIAQIRSLIDLH